MVNDDDDRDLLSINTLDLDYGHDWTSIGSIEGAVAFVQSILNDATKEEYERIKEIYCGVSVRDEPPARRANLGAQRGGGESIRIYRLYPSPS